MKKINLSEIPEPSWLKEVAPNSYMNAKDLADMFKLKTSTLYLKVEQGEFPPPDTKLIVGRNLHGRNDYSHKSQWRISTIRKFFKQQGEAKNEQSKASNP